MNETTTMPPMRPVDIAEREGAPPVTGETVFTVDRLTASYGRVTAISDVDLEIYRNLITAVIGPSGCGKSTFIRCLNRMNDLVPGARIEGKILYDGDDLYAAGVDPVDVRRRIGMVFQKANPFPKSIYATTVSTDIRHALPNIPVQIFIWSESSDPADHKRAWASALVLLLFVLLTSLLARAALAQSRRKLSR